MIFITFRLLIYVMSLVAVLYSITTVSRVPGNGSRHGLRLMLLPLIAYAGVLVLATVTKMCVDIELSQWLFTISAGVTIVSQLLLWRWWKGL